MKKIKTPLSIFTATLVALTVSQSISAAPPAFKSGKYEMMLIAVTPDKKVEGYYFEDTGQDVSRKCSFYLSGQADDANKIQVSTWTDSSSFEGSLTPSNKEVVLNLPEMIQHPGCNSQPDEGSPLTLIKSSKWIGLLNITADKVYLQKKPDPKSKHSAYVVKGDVVGLIEDNGDWAYVEFINDQDRYFRGWISSSQYAHFKKN